MLGNRHHSNIRRGGAAPSTVKLALAVVAFLACQGVGAQVFTDHLTAQGGEGTGTVTITQDQRLTNRINNGVTPTIVTLADSAGNNNGATAQVPKKKMRGFRIQMYWGNAQRSDQKKAEQMGERVTALYPELEAYTDFSSPHWRCRVGDFTSRDQAAEYLPKLRQLSSDAMIVISEIYVEQQ